MTDSVVGAIKEIGSAFDEFKAVNDGNLEKMNSRLDALQDRIEIGEAQNDRPRAIGDGGDAKYSRDQVEHKGVFLEWVRRPTDARCIARISEAQHEMSKKDVSIGTPAAGGYGLPKQIADEIEHRVRQLNPFRDNLVDVVQSSTNDFNYLVSMGDGTSGWSSETGARSATNSPTLRNIQPTMGELYALPTASNWSLEDVKFDVQKWLVEDIAADWSSAEATAIISGTGSNQPTGILNTPPTASEDNASPMRGQDVIQFINVTSPTSPATAAALLDSCIDLVAKLRERYIQEADRCAFVMHRATAAKLRKQKASTAGSYLWEGNAQAGQPATLLGYRVVTCDAMPLSTVAGGFPILFGNFRRGYVLVDRSEMQITLDPYSTPGKTRFYARRRVGGRIKNNDAIKALCIDD